MKIDWNIAFTWLKHNVKPVENQWAFINPHHNKVFIQILRYNYLEKISWRVLSAVSAYWKPCTCIWAAKFTKIKAVSFKMLMKSSGSPGENETRCIFGCPFSPPKLREVNNNNY